MAIVVASIPLKVLVHELQYEQYNGINSYGDDTFLEAINISNVRVEETVEFKRDISENTVNPKYVIFYDGKHSNPQGVQFKERSKITFNGTVMVINKVLTFNQPFSTQLHHIEVECL